MKLTPSSLKIVLLSTIGLLIILSVIGFWFIHGQLTSFADEVKNDNITAASSSKDAAKLEQLKVIIDKNQVAIARTKKIVGDTKLYQYQNQIIDDLTSYATNAGFKIVGFSFTTDDPSNPASKAAAAATPAAGATPTPAGLKTTLATITLPKFVSFIAYMNFLKSIENNLTKMEIDGIAIHLDPATANLSPDPISIGVYIR